MFKVYASSAGSGKTYTLTREYISLALMDDPDKGKFSPFYFKHILAVTFTNKAAEEMKERIMQKMQLLGSNLNLSGGDALLLQQVQATINQRQALQLSERDVRFRAAKVFQTLIHDYSDFSVSTIDSFVQRIVAAFTEELNIPYNFEVNLDQEVLLEAAAAQLLNKVGSAEYKQLTFALKDFALHKANEGKSLHTLTQELADAGRVLFNENYHTAVSEAISLETKQLLQIRTSMLHFNQHIQKDFEAIAQQALSLIDSHHIGHEHFYQARSGVGAYLKQWTTDFGKRFKESCNSYVRKALDEDVWYTLGKKKLTPEAYQAQEKIDFIKGDLASYIRQLEELREELFPKYALFEQLSKHFFKLSLLSKLKEEINDIQQETGAIHISHFNKAITDIVLQEEIPFIYERLGEKYHHILIDEFQDTSMLQWINFLPLISNALSYDHFNLAVGDGKQSIYRWRGGDMDLIVNLHQKQVAKLLEHPSTNDKILDHYRVLNRSLRADSLATNYRSCEEIIAFNNTFFKYIIDAKSEEFESLAKVYDTFRQELPAKPRGGGHVELRWVVPDAMFEEVKYYIEQAIQDGYSFKDIAILNRTNIKGRQIANYLKEEGYEIISQDSLCLSFSDSVNFVVSLMRVMHNSQNQLAKYEALFLYYRLVRHELPDNDTLEQLRPIIESDLLDDFYEYISPAGSPVPLFSEMAVASLYDLAEQIIQQFKLFDRIDAQAFLFRFLDVMIEFTTTKGNHLADFLQYWDLKKDAIAINTPENTNAITITSIHKSKGLEYPVVIIPNAHWSYVPRPETIHWIDLEKMPYDEMGIEQAEDAPLLRLKFAPISMQEDLKHTLAAPQYLQEKERTFIENINMLYVAFTRPRDRLYVLVSKRKNSAKNSVGQLLEDYCIAEGLLQSENGNVVVAKGMPNQASRVEAVATATIEIEDVITYDRSKHIKLRRLAEKAFDLETLEASKDWGNKVHYALSLVKSHADIDIAIDTVGREGLVNKTEAEELRGRLRAVVSIPAISYLFEPNLKVENEREILTKTGNYRTDRVVYLPNGKVVIIDYKTGTPRESHEQQVKNYLRLYQQMGFEKVEGLLVYLESLEVKSI
jgi:ATP-dependent helicase/nuclease subunit A